MSSEVPRPPELTVQCRVGGRWRRREANRRSPRIGCTCRLRRQIRHSPPSIYPNARFLSQRYPAETEARPITVRAAVVDNDDFGTAPAIAARFDRARKRPQAIIGRDDYQTSGRVRPGAEMSRVDRVVSGGTAYPCNRSPASASRHTWNVGWAVQQHCCAGIVELETRYC